MKTLAIIISMTVFALGAIAGKASAQEPDSLKVKNEAKAQNKGADQKLRIRTQEQTQAEKPEDAGEGRVVTTRNEGEEDKLRVRTEEGDKARGQAIQSRFRDENGDGIPDSTQAQKKERNRHRVRNQEKKHGESENMTPQGGASEKRNKRGSQTPAPGKP